MAIARQFKSLIGFQRDVLQMMVQLLFRIALADGKMHPDEDSFIRQIAATFDMSSTEFEQIRAIYIKQNDRAYSILGITKNATDNEVKKAYARGEIKYGVVFIDSISLVK